MPVRASESVSAPDVAPESPAAPTEPADAVPPAPERVRFRARVRIHAGVTYEPGAEIGAELLEDNLRTYRVRSLILGAYKGKLTGTPYFVSKKSGNDATFLGGI